MKQFPMTGVDDYTLLCRTDAGKLYLSIDKILECDPGNLPTIDVNLHTLFELRDLLEPFGIQKTGVLRSYNHSLVAVPGNLVDLLILDHRHRHVPFG